MQICGNFTLWTDHSERYSRIHGHQGCPSSGRASANERLCRWPAGVVPPV